MRVHFKSTAIPNRFVKAMCKVLPELRHSFAQKVTAKMFGYRDWYDLAQHAHANKEEPTDFWSLAPLPREALNARLKRNPDVFTPELFSAFSTTERFKPQLHALEQLNLDSNRFLNTIDCLRQIYQTAYGKVQGATLQRRRPFSAPGIDSPDVRFTFGGVPYNRMLQLFGEPDKDLPFSDASNPGMTWHYALNETILFVLWSPENTTRLDLYSYKEVDNLTLYDAIQARVNAPRVTVHPPFYYQGQMELKQRIGRGHRLDFDSWPRRAPG